MSERILGPVGSKRRRRFLWVPMLLVACAALFVIAGAQAVHDTGVFQMDGDAQTVLNSTPPAAEDWDLICKANPSTCTFDPLYSVPSGATTATASAHIADGVDASIFTGGGSKDPQDLPNWKWKDGSVPDKDNLQHAFAARYSIAPSTSCPVASGLTTCDLLYFGSDRFDNSGDAQQGFWFFQNKVVLNSATGKFENGQGGPAVHADGDLLIVSDFSNGGTASTINVYKWVGGALTFLAGGDAAKCASTLSGPDPFCGIVNPANGTVAPWTFTDKSANHTYLNGELYEAGLNLSDPTINLAGECFSSFVAETRSSTSTTATLKDFVLGQFAVCTAGMATLPKLGDGTTTATSVSPGTAVHDLATVTGNKPTKTPSGTVTFYLCSFAVGSSATCDGTTNVGVSINTTGCCTLSGSGGIATATSPEVNTSTSKLAPGHYCFRAHWPGDTNYPGVTDVDGAAECFEVATIPTAISTAQSFYPNDSATVSTSDGSNVPPGGSVVFKPYIAGGGNTAAVNCANNLATGLLFAAVTKSIVGGATTETVGTANTTVAMPPETIIAWRVTYTSNSNTYENRQSACTETTTLSITNDSGPGTKP